jgi:hypothetical protein
MQIHFSFNELLVVGDHKQERIELFQILGLHLNESGLFQVFYPVATGQTALFIIEDYTVLTLNVLEDFALDFFEKSGQETKVPVAVVVAKVEANYVAVQATESQRFFARKLTQTFVVLVKQNGAQI